jgi:hypothetical protein
MQSIVFLGTSAGTPTKARNVRTDRPIRASIFSNALNHAILNFINTF